MEIHRESSSSSSSNSRVYSQSGEGRGEEENPRFIIEGESTRFYRRFGYEGREIRGVLAAPPPMNADFHSWLEDCVRDLHRQLCERGGPSDFIGVTINSEQFNRGPLWLSFRLIGDFLIEDLWGLLYSAVQSANEFNVNERLAINCAIVKDIVGNGRVRLTEKSVNKKSILTIVNSDNLCLPRSLVTAYTYAIRGQIRTGELHRYWNLIRNSGGRTQRNAAMELVNLANVQVPDHGCGLQEIRKFQDYFATRNTAIVVYNFSTFGRSAPPIYDGTQTVGVTYGNAVLHVLRIMYYERAHHYQPILNLVAAGGSAGYCIPCNKSYWRAEEHRCSNKCYKCMSSPPCSRTEVLKKCNDCLRLFFGDNCRANHVKKGTYNRNSSVCSKVKLCQNCFKIIQINRKDPHKCGISYCTTCKSRVPIRHLCHVQPIKSSNSTNLALFLFYDFETQQSLPVLGDEEKKVHVPNLCVVQQVCTYCIEIEDISIRCEKCGTREYVFADEPVKEFVELAIAPREQFQQVICIAHNSQGFDAQFIFKYIVETFNEGRVVPSVVMNGSKIILMEVLQAKFIDSLNYFHMSLASLPKAYGLPDMEKGVFPHLFNTAENQSYEGPLPPLDSYAAESMSVGERENFLKWYTDQQRGGYTFNFQSEIVKYCKQDVKILRLACLAFRKTFMKYNVDPFVECTTIASSCMRVFRKKFLKKDQIGIIPPHGYRMTDNQSEIALHWLAWMEQRVLHRHIEHAGRGQEKRLTEGIVVDGYCAAQENEAHRGIVLQFHGCFWHGCPRCYTINRDLDLTSGESMDARYEKTLAISDRIMTANYQLIEKWECQFNTEISQNEELRRFVDENRRNVRRKPLDPRDAFFGGRTGNTVKVFDCQGQEKIKYVDVCSLYPFICKHGKYPVGHPKIFVGEEECRQLIGINNDISQVNGLISCDILPPQNLYHPLLPVKMHGKLIFPLCRTCCEQLTQDDCPHEDPEERVLRGTWVSEEVKAAVTLGYVVKFVYEIWQYEMTQYSQEDGTGGIFAEYINEFFTQKVAASGYPPECITEEDKERYVEQLKHNEGIDLNKHDICLNAGLRSVAKLCLNSLWGKFGQRENLTRTLVVKNRETLMNLLASAEVEVNGILPVNDDTLYVNWCYRDEALTSSVSSSMTNVVLAAFTTAQARLKLFGYLHALGPRALYYDTDSVFYVCKGEIGEFELPIGTSLGSLTDELADKGPGTYITSFLSGGPKFYAYKCRKPNGQEECVCKVKGIRLNYANSQLVNFDSIREMITSPNLEIVMNNSAIRRTAFHDVITQKETKTCKPVYNKRRFIALDKSYPYGYKLAM